MNTITNIIDEFQRRTENPTDLFKLLFLTFTMILCTLIKSIYFYMTTRKSENIEAIEDRIILNFIEESEEDMVSCEDLI